MQRMVLILAVIALVTASLAGGCRCPRTGRSGSAPGRGTRHRRLARDASKAPSRVLRGGGPRTGAEIRMPTPAVAGRCGHGLARMHCCMRIATAGCDAWFAPGFDAAVAGGRSRPHGGGAGAAVRATRRAEQAGLLDQPVGRLAARMAQPRIAAA